MSRKRNLKNDRFWDSAWLNQASYQQYYNRLMEMAISIFEWSGLPDTIDPRFLELVLFQEGKCVFFEDEVMGYLALQTTINGQFDVYRNPIKNRAYAVNGYQQNLDLSNSVIIYNNYLRQNSVLDIELFARRLAELDRTIDVNAKAQKTPILLQCDESQRLTLLNLYKNYDGNEPFIFGDKKLNTDGVSSITTGAPYVADKLYELKTQIWNEALTYLGIPNISQSKKERMITDEVTRMQGGAIASRYSRLEARREACDKINKMFGLNISCKYREDIENKVGEDPTNEGMEGGLDE